MPAPGSELFSKCKNPYSVVSRAHNVRDNATIYSNINDNSGNHCPGRMTAWQAGRLSGSQTHVSSSKSTALVTWRVVRRNVAATPLVRIVVDALFALNVSAASSNPNRLSIDYQQLKIGHILLQFFEPILLGPNRILRYGIH